MNINIGGHLCGHLKGEDGFRLSCFHPPGIDHPGTIFDTNQGSARSGTGYADRGRFANKVSVLVGGKGKDCGSARSFALSHTAAISTPSISFSAGRWNSVAIPPVPTKPTLSSCAMVPISQVVSVRPAGSARSAHRRPSLTSPGGDPFLCRLPDTSKRPPRTGAPSCRVEDQAGERMSPIRNERAHK